MEKPRAQAIADGDLVLVDRQLAKQAGFRCPLALTREAYADCVAWTDDDTKRTGVPQDTTGRLWDVLWMARRAAGRTAHGSFATFQMLRISRAMTPALMVRLEDGELDEAEDPRIARLLVQCGPGDDGEPVMTIMRPNQFEAAA